MDTQYTLQPRTRMHPHLSRAIGAVLIAALIVLALYGAYRYWGMKSSSGPNLLGNARVTLSANSLPPHNVQLIDLSHKKIVPDHIDSQGTQNLYADVLTKDTGFYLISGPAAEQSTLYSLDLTHPDAGLKQISTSTTEKIELSVNEPAKAAAFTSYANKGVPHVVAISLKSGKETDLGEGAHPSVLADGSSVLFEKAGTLVSKEIASGKEYTLAKLPDGAPFAVDTYASQFAFYDAAKNSIRTYQIMNSGTLSQQSDSSTPADRPEALFYVNHVLYMARIMNGALILNAANGSSSMKISAPGFSLGGFTITAL